MATGSNAKQKSSRGKIANPRFRIADWTVQQATTPGDVSLSLVSAPASADGASRPTTRRFLLRCERAAELVNQLKAVLDESAASQRLEGEATCPGSAFTAQPDSISMHANVDDTDVILNHLDLGAYGLVGN